MRRTRRIPSLTNMEESSMLKERSIINVGKKILRGIRNYSFIFIIIILVLGWFQAVTLIYSFSCGDPYVFPMSLWAKNEVEDNPEFQKYLKNKDMVLKELNWLTAKRKGDVWIFYIEVQDKPIPKEKEIDAVANRWSYYSNGDVFYNTNTKQILVQIHGHDNVKLG